MFARALYFLKVVAPEFQYFFELRKLQIALSFLALKHESDQDSHRLSLSYRGCDLSILVAEFRLVVAHSFLGDLGQDFAHFMAFCCLIHHKLHWFYTAAKLGSISVGTKLPILVSFPRLPIFCHHFGQQFRQSVLHSPDLHLLRVNACVKTQLLLGLLALFEQLAAQVELFVLLRVPLYQVSLL